MTPKERLYARLAGKSVDKIPNLSIVMMFAAKFTNTPYSEFVKDYRVLVDSQGATAEHFHLDILSTMSDPFRETMDYGAKISFPYDNLPVCDKKPIGDITDWQKSIHKFDPLSGGRIYDRIRACELFRKRYGDEYPVLGWAEGPLAELCDLGGVNEIMLALYDEEDAVKEALEFITEQQLKCAVEQVKAGADFIGVGDAVASLISPDMYDELVFPYEKKLISGIKQCGGHVKLHICGNINHIISRMAETGPDIIDIDYYVDYKKAVEIGKDKIAICGNIDPVEVIYQGNPDLVRKYVADCVAAGRENSIISSGCEVPRDTDPANLMAIHEALVC